MEAGGTPIWRDRRFVNAWTALGLTGAILIAVLVLLLLVVWQNYKSALTSAEARTTSAAHVVSAHISWMIEAADQALRRIDVALGDQGARTAEDISNEIRQATGDLPAGFRVSIFDQAGNLQLTEDSDLKANVNIADREYFRQLKDGQSIVVSGQLWDRISDKSVFVVARRIARQGEFRGIAAIAISSRRMNEFWTAIRLGENSSISVVRMDGWIVARHPQIPEPMNIADSSPLFQIHLAKSPAGVYQIESSPADGRARIVSYRKVDRWPLVATASVERTEAFRMFWSSLRKELAFGLPVAALLVFCALLIGWLLRAHATRNAQIEDALEHNRMLFREIHHRVKNNLQAVSSLIRLQPISDDISEKISRRISAMIAVHEHIYNSDQFDNVDIASYVEQIVAQIARSYPGDIEIVTRLQSVIVDRDAALPIGMILNEVVSNAFKYAFPGRKKGRLTVDLNGEGDHEKCLTIRDDGPGFNGVEPKGGMGSRLIAGFVAQIGGTFSIDGTTGQGVVFTMRFPAKSPAQAV